MVFGGALCPDCLLFAVWLPCSGHGRWPERDPWGREFGESYMPEWAAKSNEPLAGPWRGCLDGVSGDQEWVHKTFTLKRGLAFTIRLIEKI